MNVLSTSDKFRFDIRVAVKDYGRRLFCNTAGHDTGHVATKQSRFLLNVDSWRTCANKLTRACLEQPNRSKTSLQPTQFKDVIFTFFPSPVSV